MLTPNKWTSNAGIWGRAMGGWNRDFGGVATRAALTQNM